MYHELTPSLQKLYDHFTAQNPKSTRRRNAFADLSKAARRSGDVGLVALSMIMHGDDDDKTRAAAARAIMATIPTLNPVQLERVQAWYHESMTEDEALYTIAQAGWQMVEDRLAQR